MERQPRRNTYKSTQQTATTTLSEGAKSFTVTANDNAGNAGTPAGASVTIDNTVPTRSALEMFDGNGNGKVDQVKAMVMQETNVNGKVDHVVVTFSESLASSTLTAPWTLASAPSGGSLSSVATSGATATLTLSEGAGAADTSVGSFTVALAASATGIRMRQGTSRASRRRLRMTARRP